MKEPATRIVPLALMLSFVLIEPAAAESSGSLAYEPISNYTSRDVRGWTVHVHQRLLKDQRALGDRTLELIDTQLYEITRTVPSGAVAKLREIPIWLEFNHEKFRCACYHVSKKWLTENGVNPEKTGAVEIANAATYLKWTGQQPSMLLHELAHGYHHQFLGGYESPRIKAAYERAKASGSYESVLHWNGKHVTAYAMNNPQEYFAELSEAWFGTNDFYPFVRAEVMQHDPKAIKVLERAWGE